MRWGVATILLVVMASSLVEAKGSKERIGSRSARSNEDERYKLDKLICLVNLTTEYFNKATFPWWMVRIRKVRIESKIVGFRRMSGKYDWLCENKFSESTFKPPKQKTTFCEATEVLKKVVEDLDAKYLELDTEFGEDIEPETRWWPLIKPEGWKPLDTEYAPCPVDTGCFIKGRCRCSRITNIKACDKFKSLWEQEQDKCDDTDYYVRTYLGMTTTSTTTEPGSGSGSGACETSSGPKTGSSCIFPFKYENVKYETCTSVDNNNVLWCPTRVNENREYISGEWGNCDPSCSGSG